MYRVIKHFTDLKDSNHSYNVGDTYPRSGMNPTASRIKELASSKNRQGEPLIVEIKEKPVKEMVENTEDK
jgi:hypothetical protein